MFLALIIISVTILIITLIKTEIERIKNSKKYRHIPGPNEYPLIGNILYILQYNKNDFGKLVDLMCPHPINKLHGFGTIMFNVADPDVIKQVLTLPEFRGRPFFGTLLELDQSIVTTNYHLWKPLRKGLNPFFSQRSVISMIPALNKHIDCLNKKLGKYLDAEEFDLYPFMLVLGLDQLFEAVFGVEYKNTVETCYKIDEATNALAARILNPVLHPFFMFWLSPLYKTFTKGRQEINFILQESGLKPVQPGSIKTEENNNVEDKNMSFINKMSTICIDGRSLTEAEIEENLKAFTVTGFSTTALALTYTILMLAMHPDVDEKLYREICELYEVTDSECTYDSVKQMKYLDMVFKETLRLFPVAPLPIRESLTDVNLDKIGHVPKGAIINICIFKLHRCKTIWGPDADKFNPDNFLPENISKRHSYSYIPFSGGNRNCIGMHYSNISVRISLAKILSKYKFTSNVRLEDLKFQYNTSLMPINKLLVQIHRR